MKITDLIGEEKAFEPPFECHIPIGNREKIYIWDKNSNCLLEIRGARHLQKSMNYHIDSSGIQELQYAIGNHICDLLNKEHCSSEQIESNREKTVMRKFKEFINRLQKQNIQ